MFVIEGAIAGTLKTSATTIIPAIIAYSTAVMPRESSLMHRSKPRWPATSVKASINLVIMVSHRNLKTSNMKYP
jgi:hypothetical protein